MVDMTSVIEKLAAAAGSGLWLWPAETAVLYTFLHKLLQLDGIVVEPDLFMPADMEFPLEGVACGSEVMMEVKAD